MTFPQLQEFLETEQPMRMYLRIGDKPSKNLSAVGRQLNPPNTVVLPVVFSHMSFLLIQALCETGHGEFRISSEKKNHELAVYLGSHICYRYLLKPQHIEAIWYLFLKYKGFRKADLRSPATIRVQENEKS